MKHLRLALPCLALVGVACAPNFDDRPYLLERARLIAVVAEPAEARPRDTVTLTPVVTGAGAGALSFRFCKNARSLSDPRPVAEACLGEPGITLESYGVGARGALPADACERFGPDPSGSSLRPVDADATGGFYQPVIVSGLGEQAVTLLRIHCSLPDAPEGLARELDERYELNQNPKLSGLEVLVNGEPASELSLPAGAATELRVSWPESAKERYLWLPPDGDRVASKNESLRVSWFAASGSFASSATSDDAESSSSSSSNTFIADANTTRVDVWTVLQDSRGGSAAKRWRLRILP